MSDEKDEIELPSHRTKNGDFTGGKKVRIRPGQAKERVMTEKASADIRTPDRIAEVDKGYADELEVASHRIVPKWVLDAEKDYITRKIGTTRQLAAKYGQEPYLVRKWAQNRAWTERRRRAETEAAQRLADKIDDEAAQSLCDAFSGMDQDVITAGQYAARMHAMFLRDELEQLQEAKKNGTRFTPKGTSQGILAAVKLAHELRPKKQENDARDGLEDILNPESADDSPEKPPMLMVSDDPEFNEQYNDEDYDDDEVGDEESEEG